LQFELAFDTIAGYKGDMLMKNSGQRQRIYLAILLILLSVFFYALSYAIFHDAHDIFFYLIQDIGFVFVQVLLVTLVIEQILSYREKRSLLRKLNMVIGAFFSEVGTDLLRLFSAFDTSSDRISRHLVVDNEWSPKHFEAIRKRIEHRDYKIDCHAGRLDELKTLAEGKREFLLGLLENPNLLEHESFTELLWAVFHLAEELSHRKTVASLPETDYRHLASDIKRAYKLLVREWLMHMEHLKNDYPYLFSLAMRTNPFDADASVEVKELEHG
jgi:hypothetical protein